MRLLVVEDYSPLRKNLARGLRECGHVVDETGDGAVGFGYTEKSPYDVIVLDLMLPGMNGWEFLRNLRSMGHGASVLILTAKDAVEDRVRGLELGADDYLVKPFAFSELRARINALGRRKFNLTAPTVRIGDLEIHPGSRSISRGGKRIELSLREYAVLEVLALRSGRIVSRAEIADHVYGLSSEPSSNVVDVYIGYLRKKIDRDGLPPLIHTRRGIGYMLEAHP